MIDRGTLRRVLAGLEQMPGVVLLGPRQIGKTTLAHQVMKRLGGDTTYLDLARQVDAAMLADPRAFLERHPGLVVLDEVQRIPELFSTLRGVIDDRRAAGARTGQFLLLGSASHDLLRQSSESLAGRVRYIELPPVLAVEVPTKRASREELWLRGGFPESLLAGSDDASVRWRDDLITTYLERDIPTLMDRVPAAALRRLWTMLAHNQGRAANAAELGRSLELDSRTVNRYVDVLVDLMLVRRVPPWFANVGKRLAKAPRLYVRDSGLAHALLGIESLDALLSHPIAGASWEGFVLEQLVDAVDATTSNPGWYYRTSGGAELDLLLDLQARGRWAIEIKRASAPQVSRGFHVAAGDVGATRRIVVHGGDTSYPMRGEVDALSLADAVAQLRAAALRR